MNVLNLFQQILLVAGLLSISAGIYFFFNEKKMYSVIFLVIFSGITGLFMASLDPFLNIWDERFHALVAKNIMSHPLKPTLYDNPVVEMDYNHWLTYHVWLHKQPLFLWQIALSFKIFGVNEFTLRLPNAIMFTVLIYASYRTGKLLVNHEVGFLTGLFTISSYFILNLLAGRQAVDHSDFSFLVYVSLSLWSLIEYQQSNNKIWIIFIGIFSGFALLCKWVVGLLVYFVWFVFNLQGKKLKKIISWQMVLAVFITLAIALPWQLYTYKHYPVEAALAFKYNLRHMFEVLDEQTSHFFYHFSILDLLYGSLTSLLVVPGFVCLVRKSNNSRMIYALISGVLLVYLFFSFAVTKMPAYTVIVALPVMLAISSLFDYIRNEIDKRKIHLLWRKTLFALIVFGFILIRFDFKSLKEHHFSWKDENSYSSMLLYNKEIFKSLNLPANTVIFNVRGHHYVESMFYTGLPSYNFMPTQEHYLDLKQKNYRMALFKPVDGVLPSWIAENKDIIVIDQILKGYSW